MVKLNQILAFKEAGFSLNEIAELFTSNLPKEKFISLLEQKAEILEDALKAEQERVARLRTNIFLIKNGGIPMVNEITVKKVEPILIASLRTTISDYNQMGPLWEELNGYIDKKGVKKIIPCMTLYHNGWDTPANMDIEVVEPVVKPFEGNDRVTVYALDKADKMACIVHNGPFETIAQTYTAIIKWIEENGYEVEGPAREIYHKGDWVTNNPQEYVTEIQFPLKDS